MTSKNQWFWPLWIFLMVLVLSVLFAALAHADAKELLGMCLSDEKTVGQVEHGYCEGYIAAVKEQANLYGPLRVCTGKSTSQEVLVTVVRDLDLSKNSSELTKIPTFSVIYAILAVRYPCRGEK